MELIRKIISWLRSLFRRKQVLVIGTESYKPPVVRTPIIKPIEVFRHSMPKRQPCAICGFNSKRQKKTRAGANYDCRTHGIFLVLHPLARRIK